MNFTTYLIISSACLGISYFLYRLLRKEILFLQQRIFLTASVILSLSLPLTKISITLNPGNQELAAAYQVQTSASPVILSETPPISSIIRKSVFGIYGAVTSIFVLIIIMQILRIAILYYTSERSVHESMVILKSKRIKTSFSFFRWVFIPAELKDPAEKESICLHESIHARQFHSIDNLIMELACSIMWFNPFIWIMKKSLHLVHEYMADEGTLQGGIDKQGYQTLLVNQAAEVQLIRIPSGFNNNLLKKRIIMMTKTNIKESRRIRIISIIPLPIILVFAVSVFNGLFPRDLNAQKEVKQDKEKSKEITVTGYGTSTPGSAERVQDKENTREIIVTGYGNQSSGSTQKEKRDTINYIVDGVRRASVDDINPDSIESVDVLKKDNTVIIRTKGFSRSNLQTQKLDIRSTKSPEKVLYIVDDKKVTEAEFKNISPDSIESMDVVRYDKIKNYTSEDYDAVIVVETKH